MKEVLSIIISLFISIVLTAIPVVIVVSYVLKRLGGSVILKIETTNGEGREK